MHKFEPNWFSGFGVAYNTTRSTKQNYSAQIFFFPKTKIKFKKVETVHC